MCDQFVLTAHFLKQYLLGAQQMVGAFRSLPIKMLTMCWWPAIPAGGEWVESKVPGSSWWVIYRGIQHLFSIYSEHWGTVFQAEGERRTGPLLEGLKV